MISEWGQVWIRVARAARAVTEYLRTSFDIRVPWCHRPRSTPPGRRVRGSSSAPCRCCWTLLLPSSFGRCEAADADDDLAGRAGAALCPEGFGQVAQPEDKRSHGTQPLVIDQAGQFAQLGSVGPDHEVHPANVHPASVARVWVLGDRKQGAPTAQHRPGPGGGV